MKILFVQGNSEVEILQEPLNITTTQSRKLEPWWLEDSGQSSISPAATYELSIIDEEAEEEDYCSDSDDVRLRMAVPGKY